MFTENTIKQIEKRIATKYGTTVNHHEIYDFNIFHEFTPTLEPYDEYDILHARSNFYLEDNLFQVDDLNFNYSIYQAGDFIEISGLASGNGTFTIISIEEDRGTVTFLTDAPSGTWVNGFYNGSLVIKRFLQTVTPENPLPLYLSLFNDKTVYYGSIHCTVFDDFSLYHVNTDVNNIFVYVNSFNNEDIETSINLSHSTNNRLEHAIFQKIFINHLENINSNLKATIYFSGVKFHLNK
jgi:hypothetical protein